MSEDYTFSHNRPAEEVIIRLTAEGFGKVPSQEFAKDAIAVVEGCEHVISASSTVSSEIVGYIGFSLLSVSSGALCYVSTTMIDTQYQGKGLAGELMSKAIGQTEPDYVGFKTQSARSYAVALKSLIHVQPDLVNGVIYEDVWTAGVELASQKGGSFPVVKRAYEGAPLYTEKQSHGRLSDFYDFIDFDAGDAIYCVGLPPVEYRASKQ